MAPHLRLIIPNRKFGQWLHLFRIWFSPIWNLRRSSKSNSNIGTWISTNEMGLEVSLSYDSGLHRRSMVTHIWMEWSTLPRIIFTLQFTNCPIYIQLVWRSTTMDTATKVLLDTETIPRWLPRHLPFEPWHNIGSKVILRHLSCTRVLWSGRQKQNGNVHWLPRINPWHCKNGSPTTRGQKVVCHENHHRNSRQRDGHEETTWKVTRPTRILCQGVPIGKTILTLHLEHATTKQAWETASHSGSTKRPNMVEGIPTNMVRGHNDSTEQAPGVYINRCQWHQGYWRSMVRSPKPQDVFDEATAMAPTKTHQLKRAVHSIVCLCKLVRALGKHIRHSVLRQRDDSWWYQQTLNMWHGNSSTTDLISARSAMKHWCGHSMDSVRGEWVSRCSVSLWYKESY